jgi:glycosyltransferase involved in cell wall biosynthesis
MLVKYLLELDKQNQYFFLVEKGEPPSIFTQVEHPFSWIQINKPWLIKSPWWQRTFRQHVLLPLFLFRLNLDLFHFSCHLDAPLYPLKKSVVSVMDIIPLRMSHLYSKKRPYPIFATARSLETRAIRNATKVIAISHQTKKDLVEFLQIDPDKIKVIYPGISNQFQPVTNPRAIASIRSRYGLKNKYILYLGGIDARKNIARLIQAFVNLVKEPDWSDYMLVCAGDITKDAQFPQLKSWIKDSGVDTKIKTIGYVPEEDLPILYSAAELFVYPSLYEGFGLPVLEAMACGIPVVCAHAPGITEVAGDASISFNPSSTDSLVRAMRMGLKESHLRQTLIQRGFQQAAKFCWDKAAQKTLEVYLEL